MKRILLILLCIVLCASAVSCRRGTHEGDSETLPPATDGVETPSTPDTKVLVVYFSMPDSNDNSSVEINGETLGNTQYMAYVIQESTGADIFRIVPTVPYPTDHDELMEYAQNELTSETPPTFRGRIESFDYYDTVFIGYPNWWADMPRILYTFFDTYDFSGKTIITFNTHGGLGFSGTNETIAALEPNARVIPGLAISRNDIQDAEGTIMDWVKTLGLYVGHEPAPHETAAPDPKEPSADSPAP